LLRRWGRSRLLVSLFKEALHSRLLAKPNQRMRRRLLRLQAVQRSRGDIDSSIEIFNDTRTGYRVITEFSVRITMHEHERGLRLMRSLECVVEETDNIHPFNILLCLKPMLIGRRYRLTLRSASQRSF
jgi:hypothetical protein